MSSEARLILFFTCLAKAPFTAFCKTQICSNMPCAAATLHPREPNIVQALPRRSLHVGKGFLCFSGILRGGLFEVANLFDQVGLLVGELLVVGAVVLELAEELDEFGLVLQQDVQDRLGLVRVGHKHLNKQNQTP